jgi:hypothetical protein
MCVSNANVAVGVLQECAIASIQPAKVSQSGLIGKGQPVEELQTESMVAPCTKVTPLVDEDGDVVL